MGSFIMGALRAAIFSYPRAARGSPLRYRSVFTSLPETTIWVPETMIWLPETTIWLPEGREICVKT